MVSTRLLFAPSLFVHISGAFKIEEGADGEINDTEGMNGHET